MKKIILFALVALGLTACNQKQRSQESEVGTQETGVGTQETEQWKKDIVGEWHFEAVSDLTPHAMHYQITLDIKDGGQMTETEHYTQNPAEGPAIDTDGNIFDGTWELRGDTLVKDGNMSVLTGEGIKAEGKQERVERDVKGFVKVLNVLPDTLLTLDMSGDTIVFTRK